MHKGTFGGAGNVLGFLGPDVGYLDVFILWKFIELYAYNVWTFVYSSYFNNEFFKKFVLKLEERKSLTTTPMIRY